MHLLKLFFLASVFCLMSCDDGDIIVTELDFETDVLESCFSEDNGETVFYNYNDDTDEVIYLTITGEYDTTEANDPDGQDGNVDPEGPVGSNGLVRSLRFSDEVNPGDFFCTSVAIRPIIERELNGTKGAYIITTTDIVDISEDADEDGDGISNLNELFIDESDIDVFSMGTDEEGNSITITELNISDSGIIDKLKDTDNDGIPNFRDQDDDNDNVRTSDELYSIDLKDVDEDGDITDFIIKEDPDGNPMFLDTNGDGTLNYLDDDDDGDGILTILEFSNINGKPSDNTNTNDDGLAAYLNVEVPLTREFEEDENIILLNSYNTQFETIVLLENTTLSEEGSSSSVTFEDEFFLGKFTENSNPQFQVIIQPNNGTFKTIEVETNNGLNDLEDARELDEIRSGTLIGFGMDNNETTEETPTEETPVEETP